MIATILEALGILMLAGFALVLLGAASRVYSIANDTRTMVVLLRRVLDLTTDYGTTRKEDDDVES